jgi:hypothetical protein
MAYVSIIAWFTDDTQTVIKGYFGAPPMDPDLPNVVTITSDDPRWKTFYDEMAAMYAAAGLPEPDSEVPDPVEDPPTGEEEEPATGDTETPTPTPTPTPTETGDTTQ